MKKIAPPTAIDVPNTTTLQDLIVDNGQLRLKTNEEKLKDKKIELFKNY